MADLDEILAHPLSDAPRRRWADRVGGPRGALVRAQLALPDPVREAEARRLLRDHGAAWAAPIAPWVTAWEFRRGFVERVTMTAEALLRHGEALRRATPILQIRLRQVRDVDRDTLLAHPALQGLLALDLSSERVGDEFVAALAVSPAAAELRWLSLYDCDVGEQGAEALVAADLPALRWVAFAGNRVSLGPVPGGVDPMDGAIVAWDFGPLDAELQRRHGRRAWLDVPPAWPPDLYELLPPR